MPSSFINAAKRIRPATPSRMDAFRSKLEPFIWNAEHAKTSFSARFCAVDDLAQAEVRHYYRRRGTRALISGWARIIAWLLGTIGLLPLLAAVKPDFFGPWGQFGYAFLAGAALFGGTAVHGRSVTAQPEPERTNTASRIR